MSIVFIFDWTVPFIVCKISQGGFPLSCTIISALSSEHIVPPLLGVIVAVGKGLTLIVTWTLSLQLLGSKPTIL